MGAILPDTYSEMMPGATGWTAWMSYQLHLTQQRLGVGCCCCYRKGVSVGGQSSDVPDDHVDKEWLFDFTWYNAWEHHAQPCVLIEHENQGGFLTDQWKLLFG